MPAVSAELLQDVDRNCRQSLDFAKVYEFEIYSVVIIIIIIELIKV